MCRGGGSERLPDGSLEARAIGPAFPKRHSTARGVVDERRRDRGRALAQPVDDAGSLEHKFALSVGPHMTV